MGLHREREEDLDNELNRGALWAVTYGDLMSFLMIFFLLLFALSLRGGKNVAEGLGELQVQFGGKASGDAVRRIDARSKEAAAAVAMKDRLYAKGLQKFVTIDVTESRVQITLSEPILFESGDDRLKPAAEFLLREFAESVRDLPNTIVVEGHTDDRPLRGGKFRDNWDLSSARAASVVRHLVKEEGLEAGRFSAAAFAEFHPVSGNETPEGRAANRRIEIGLLRRE